MSVMAMSASVKSFAAIPDLSVYSAQLTQLNIDEKAEWLKGVDGGNIRIDLSKNKISLVLWRSWYCPTGKFCAMMMPAPELITLPLILRKTNNCGETTYVAREDKRPVDGILQSLTVLDAASSTCQEHSKLAATTVVYKTQGYDRRESVLIKTVSTFSGDRLERSVE